MKVRKNRRNYLTRNRRTEQQNKQKDLSKKAKAEKRRQANEKRREIKKGEIAGSSTNRTDCSSGIVPDETK